MPSRWGRRNRSWGGPGVPKHGAQPAVVSTSGMQSPAVQDQVRGIPHKKRCAARPPPPSERGGWDSSVASLSCSSLLSLFNMQSCIKDTRIQQGLERGRGIYYFLVIIQGFLSCCEGRRRRDPPSPFRIRVSFFFFFWLYSISCMTQGPLLNIRWPDLRIYTQTYIVLHLLVDSSK